MDIEKIVEKIAKQATKDPSILSSLMEHPYSTIGKVTGSKDVSSDDASQIVTAVSALAAGKDVDFGSLASLASGLMAENGDSVHGLSNALLGSGSSKGVDLSDGIDLDDIAGIFGKLF